MQMSGDIGGARGGQRDVHVIETDPRYVQADIETGQHLSASFCWLLGISFGQVKCQLVPKLRAMEPAPP